MDNGSHGLFSPTLTNSRANCSKQGGKRVAEHMRENDMLCDSGGLTILFDHESNRHG